MLVRLAFLIMAQVDTDVLIVHEVLAVEDAFQQSATTSSPASAHAAERCCSSCTRPTSMHGPQIGSSMRAPASTSSP
jgi:hypothetical protein